MAHRPFARGVDQLMYVGDDVTAPTVTPAQPKDLIPVAALGLVAWKTKGILRLAAAIGAGYLGLQYYAKTHTV